MNMEPHKGSKGSKPRNRPGSRGGNTNSCTGGSSQMHNRGSNQHHSAAVSECAASMATCSINPSAAVGNDALPPSASDASRIGTAADAPTMSSTDLKGGGATPKQRGSAGYRGNWQARAQGSASKQHHGHQQHGVGSPRQHFDSHIQPNGSSNSPTTAGSGSAKKPKSQQRKPGGKPSNNMNYEPYIDREEVQRGLKLGTLIQGPLRINPKNYLDAYVPHPDNRSDVYICGLHDRNRALNGDIVCVSLFPEEQWKVELNSLNDLENDVPVAESVDGSSTPVEVLEVDSSPSSSVANDIGAQSSASETLVADDVEASEHVAVSTAESTAIADLPNAGAKGRVSPQKRGIPNRYTTVKHIRDSPSQCSPRVKQLFENGGKVDGEKQVDGMIVRTGKVVYIVEKKHSRAACGQIEIMPDNKQNVKFVPRDHRMPRMLVPVTDCPQGFMERPDDFKNNLFVARLTEWNEKFGMPKGNLMRSLGEAGEIEPTTEGMLIEYGIDSSEFSEEVLSCLPQNLPWSIPQAEFEYRRDLRKQCIFTVDPLTARDLDDSLSCEELGDGLYEVGVHIADVSFFVHPDTALDNVAADRTTSVYLVQKVIPMLPRLLCEQLCSLNPDEDRLTFSVIWKMTSAGEIVDEWFGRSVIRSCAKLSYEHAQGFIEHPTREWTTEELPPLSEGFSVADVKERVLRLNEIAVSLRKKRFDGGALRLDQVKLQYTLNKETGMPSGYYVYEQKDSNRMIEEFMLLANMAVAHKIKNTYPEKAVLRRHPSPQTRQIDELVAVCEGFGITMDASSAGSLQQSIWSNSCETADEQARMQILVALCSKPMQLARYFCAGMIPDESEYHHYALNVPLYTHFTSPIRRYPDIMVHRLLAASLGYITLPEMEPSATQIQCELCNDKKLAAKRVSELSSELFFAIFLKECGPMYERGMVMNVLDRSFDVIVLKVGIVARVYCERLKLSNFSFQKVNKRPSLHLVWEPTEEHPQAVTQTLTLFTPISCVLTADEEPLKWHATVLHPSEELPST